MLEKIKNDTFSEFGEKERAYNLGSNYNYLGLHFVVVRVLQGSSSYPRTS